MEDIQISIIILSISLQIPLYMICNYLIDIKHNLSRISECIKNLPLDYIKKLEETKQIEKINNLHW